jgi:hypothetical protein
MQSITSAGNHTVDARRRASAAPPRPAPRHIARRFACLLGLLLVACASTDTPKEEADQAAVARLRSAGYAYARESGVAVRQISAQGADRTVRYNLAAAPARGAKRPVIVYLPPLGDSSTTECRWIDLWAGAGYAVLAIQPLEDDARIWTSAEARSGDFARVGRARFGDEVMADRVTRLAHLLADLRSRGDAGEAPLAGLDWTRLALAGADLGAYTVQTIAALSPQRRAALEWTLAPGAYLAISPYARRDGGAEAAAVPMLMVSSPNDVDAYGVVADPALRRIAFARAAPGDAYFLELSPVSHRWLAGIAPDQLNTPEALARRTPVFREPGVDNRGRDFRAEAHFAPVSDDEPPVLPESGVGSRAQRDIQLAEARNRQLTQRAMNEVRLEEVSVAFFDAYVRRDPRARAWLRESAAAWIEGGGGLDLK